MNKQIFKIIKNDCKLLQIHQVDLGGSTNNPSTTHSNLMLRKLLLLNYLEYFQSTYSNKNKIQLITTAINCAIANDYSNVISNIKHLVE